MLLAGGGVERVLGPHLQKIYKTQPTARAQSVSRQDVVTISVEARLAQRAREAAVKAPDLRADVVAAAKNRIESGEAVSSNDLARTILQRASERQVQ